MKTSRGPWNPRRGTPVRFGAMAGAGILAVLALSSCTPGAAGPDSAAASPTPASADPSTGAADRPAPEVLAGFLATASTAVGATKTGGWLHGDGSAWDADAPDLYFNPIPCSKDTDGSLKRELQLELKGPSAGDPVAARDRMLTHLENEGYETARVIDPPEGMDKRGPGS